MGELRAALDLELTDEGEDPRAVIAELARDAEPGLVASAGPRYFGFVVGGALPVAVAADWLTSAWDQNGTNYLVSPAPSIAEEVAGRWVKELLGLPADASTGFVTGCQMAHFTCLAAARHAVLAERGWDVEARGLREAPEIRVLVGSEAHVTIGVACRMLGLGRDRILGIACDRQGRMRVDALRAALDDWDGPAIVCAQVGNVNTGCFDPLADVVEACREHGAWCHVDGAFGLWAAASPRRRHLVAGVEGADSWATDAHKWLNVPYDCGIAIVARPEDHKEAMASTSPYIPPHDPDVPWAADWVPELSRRARGVPLYAALRHLGRAGVAELIDRCCDHAARMAALLAEGGLEVANDVVLNQVMVHVADDAEATNEVIARIQRDGTCWLSGSTFQDMPVIRISIVGWQTTAEDIERSAKAILAAARSVRRSGRR